jgi:hypothetical protein
MTIDLHTALPALLPLAIQWAEDRSREVSIAGVSLNAYQTHSARRVGVQKPERIRIVSVQTMPLPDHPALRAAAQCR